MSRIVRTSQLPGGLFMATAHVDRVATSPELAARLAGAATLGCDLDQVLITGQARDIYLVSQISPKITFKVDATAGVDALSAVCSALDAEALRDKCHGSEVPS